MAGIVTYPPTIGLNRREIRGPRVYLLIPYPPWGRGVSPRSHGDKENLTVIRAIIFLCFFKDCLRILYRFKGFTRVYRARNYQKTKGNRTKTQRKLKTSCHAPRIFQNWDRSAAAHNAFTGVGTRHCYSQNIIRTVQS